MSVMSCGKTVEVFKFRSTGLVALCQEVAGYVAQGDAPENFLRDCDLASAEYDESDTTLIIRFKRKY